jgi:hypothetical protein
LAEDLKRSGLDIWLDEWEIQVGDRITQKIEEGLNKANYLAVWLTRAGVESGWVQREWQSQYATEISSGRKIILPLLAEECNIPRLLGDVRFADFRTNYYEGVRNLLKVVGLQNWRNILDIEFSLILPGAFLMGSEEEENEQPIHQVTINRPFYMGVYVITQKQWQEVMGTEPWKGDAHVCEGDKYPAVNVSWYDAQAFLTKLGNIDKQNTYYLPDEQEWEYAARAGTTTRFSFGDDDRDMRSYGWYSDMIQNAEKHAHEVGLKKPNPWGLYDMHGNTWEWTDSWYYGSYSVKQKPGPTDKVLRGGGWDYAAKGARSAYRNYLLPTRFNHVIGFRMICRKP